MAVACFLLGNWAGVFKGQLIFYYDGIRTEVYPNGKIDLLVTTKEEKKREKMWAVLLDVPVLFSVQN